MTKRTVSEKSSFAETTTTKCVGINAQRLPAQAGFAGFQNANLFPFRMSGDLRRRAFQATRQKFAQDNKAFIVCNQRESRLND